MEARDSGPKIRPLPVDDLDVDTPQHGTVAPSRRWVPLVVIVSGAIAFGVIAAGLGSGKTEVVSGQTTTPATVTTEAPSTTTTTTPPPPPSLRELLPFAEEGLRLITLSATTAKVGEWTPDAAFPVFNANISQPTAAAFNADGTRVSVEISTSRGTAYIIDDATGGNPTYLRSAAGAIWHPDHPSLLAWSELNREETAATIRVGDLSGDTSTGLGALAEFTLDGPHVLQAWGDWGFATEVAGVTSIFDADGIETANVVGILFDANPEGILLLRAVSAEDSTPFLLYPDGSIVELPSLEVGASDYRITDDGEWVLAMTLQADGHTSLLARAIDSRSTRLTSIEQSARIVGSMADGRALILQETHSNDLVFKDWSTGAEFRVPIDTEVAAVYIEDSML